MGIISGSDLTRITLLLVIIDLNLSEVEMKISNFILKDGGCIDYDLNKFQGTNMG